MANPFLSQMVAKYAFKAWLAEARGQSARREKERVTISYDLYQDVLFSETSSDDEDEENKTGSE